MKHKISELTGALLDAAVAKAEGLTPRVYQNYDGWHCSVNEWNPDLGYYDPSSNWKHGGPIMDREFIDTAAPDEFDEDDRWFAAIYRDHARHCRPRNCEMRGETRLIAAMRAFVALKFGEEIEL